jgi:thiol-disulfide isomerase/thioredoxin
MHLAVAERTDMNRLLRLLLLAALLLAAAPASAQDGFALPGLAGGQLTPADLGQGATIVVVWASWSPRSRNIAAQVNPIAEAWRGRANVLTVNFQEDTGAAQQGSEGLQVPVYLDRDGAFAKRYSVTTLPGLVVFRDGQAVYHGKLPPNPASVLDDLLR